MKIQRSIFISMLLVLSSFALIGCGGGGGGGGGGAATPTDATQLFSTADFNSDALGTVYTFQLVGSDTNGSKLTGSISLANREQEMLNGVLVTPSDLLLSITDGITPITVTATSYTDSSGFLISVTTQTTGVTCAPVSPDVIPISVKIGDFGILSDMTCDDNTTSERNWRIEDGGNGNIRVISNTTSKDQFSEIITIADIVFTINGNGDIIALDMVSTVNALNYTLTLKSK